MRQISKSETIRYLLFILSTLIMLLFQENASSRDIYKWEDNNGNIHYSNTESGVPEEYKNENNTLKFQSELNIVGEDYEGSVEYNPGNFLNDDQPEDGVYKVKFNAYEGNTRRIIIPVSFNNSVTAQLALDTGSPGLIISTKLAKKLELYENDSGMLMSFARGIGGQVTVMRTIVDEIRIGGASETFVPAIITDSMSNAFEGLVGMDFMSKYSISIDNVNHYILLKANVDSSNYPGGHTRSWWQNTFREFKAYQDEWQRISGLIDDWESTSLINVDMTTNDIKKLRELAKWQYQESSKLLQRLESYARNHEVPQQWRR